MSRPPLSYLTAYLQFVVAVLFIVGYFGFLALLFLGQAKVADNLLELGKTLAVGLSGALGLLFAFLYLRSRIDGPPDPATTTMTQTTETVTTPSGPLQTATLSQPDPATSAQAAADAAPKPTAGGEHA